MRVMIADDNRDILETTRLVLELDGHDVVTVARAEDIVPMAARHRPQVILQDLNMPRLDLRDVLRQLREASGPDRMGILIFSAALPDEAELAAWGADGFIGKPFDVNDLRQRVRGFASA